MWILETSISKKNVVWGPSEIPSAESYPQGHLKNYALKLLLTIFESRIPLKSILYNKDWKRDRSFWNNSNSTGKSVLLTPHRPWTDLHWIWFQDPSHQNLSSPAQQFHEWWQDHDDTFQGSFHSSDAGITLLKSIFSLSTGLFWRICSLIISSTSPTCTPP